jgi:ribosome biogenesis protein ERB1
VSEDEDEGVETGDEPASTTQEQDPDLSDNHSDSDENQAIPINQVTNELQPHTKSGRAVVVDEYEYDSSDEEDLRNTIGNIPVSWYENYDHIGYDSTGRKILKPKNNNSDEVSEFLRKAEDPYYWRSVRDKFTGEQVIITDADAETVKRIRKGFHPDPNFNPFPDFVDFFTHEQMIHPVTNRPETKASFIPSLSEKRMISKLVTKIKRAWQKPKVESKNKNKERFIFDQDIWAADPDPESKRAASRRRRYIPAPKVRPPHHRESYNPPPEFCATEEEIAKWKQKDPHKRPFLAQQFPNLRSVPGYAPLVKERFNRCVDLYMCPRVRRMRADVDPEDLIPKLPRPKDLQPFPTTMAIIYKGHEDVVRSISVEPKGEYFVSGSDDKTVKVWEILTGRCFKTFQFDAPVTCVAYCPMAEKSVVAVASGRNVYLLNIHVGQRDIANLTDEMFETKADDKATDSIASEWMTVSPENKADWSQGHRAVIKHRHEVGQVTWHAKGDYFAVVLPNGGNRSVIIHQLSKKRSQIPFSKSNGIIKCVLFHPSRPQFCVATDRAVRIYDLMKQELSKKLMTNCRTTSSMAIHPGGMCLFIAPDRVLIYDCYFRRQHHRRVT